MEIYLELVMRVAAPIRNLLLGRGLTRLEMLPVRTELVRVVKVVRAGLKFLLRRQLHHVLHQHTEVFDLFCVAPVVISVSCV